MTDPTRSTGRRLRGFEPAAGLVRDRIRTAGEGRGFAVSRLLTHWAEVVGEDIARATRPVRVSYARQGLGATLTVLVRGAAAPFVEMQRATIRDRVNACYGYAAIARVVLTQSDGAGVMPGLAEEAAAFAPAPALAATPRGPDPAVARQAAAVAQGVGDPGLRSALETLAANVLSRKRP